MQTIPQIFWCIFFFFLINIQQFISILTSGSPLTPTTLSTFLNESYQEEQPLPFHLIRINVWGSLIGFTNFFIFVVLIYLREFFSPKIQSMFILSKIIKSPALNVSSNLFMSRYAFGLIKFNLPDLGEKIKEGTIKKLYVKEGDTVEQFQKIADVASDKQFTELTASNAGVIKKIYYKEDDVCQVGDLFLQILTEEDKNVKIEKTQVPTQAKKVEVVQEKKVEIEVGSSDIIATPFVRGLIKKHGLDASKLKGTGERGRILEVDVENFINKKVQVKPPKSETKQTRPKSQPPKESAKAPQIISAGEIKNISMNGFQKGMQKSMTESNTIPHLYLHEELDITEVERMRKSLKESNKKVTVMGILIKTFSLALKQYPKMNSLYHPEVNPFEYSIHSNHNISIAIDSQNGLVVPHLKNVNTLNLGDIQQELQRLRNLAKEAKLTSKELIGGTICLSNIGTIGGTLACPLILPPQVCIVAIGKLQTVPKYKNGELVERKIINVSYGCDHRVIDGATVARFSNHWKQLIENPYLSIAEMI